MVPELIPVLGSQPLGDVSHKPSVRLPLLSARPAVTLATRKRAAANFDALMGVNSLPKTVTRQRSGCDLNPGPSAPESSTLTAWLPSRPDFGTVTRIWVFLFFLVFYQFSRPSYELMGELNLMRRKNILIQ